MDFSEPNQYQFEDRLVQSSGFLCFEKKTSLAGLRKGQVCNENFGIIHLKSHMYVSHDQNHDWL